MPDEFKEKRKKHKKHKEKHVKKMRQKKNRKKIKKEKHEANILEKVLQNYVKHNYCSKEFAEKVTGRDMALIRTILGKDSLLNYVSSLDELFHPSS